MWVRLSWDSGTSRRKSAKDDKEAVSRLEDILLSSGLIPDWVLRRVIRGRVKGLVDTLEGLGLEEQRERERALLAELESGPITVDPEDANRQHYDLPPDFFRAFLGPRLKYSSCYWPDGVTDLDQAEEAMLALTAERAGLEDGQDILDLGCGWGSLSLWAAERFPHSKVLAVSNSREQRGFIRKVCAERGLDNVEVATAEIGDYCPPRAFDRVISVEMLEHVRNHRTLLGRIAGWLKPQGRLFVHVFCHRRHLYVFEPGNTGGWMAQRFFSGGIMPSWDHLPRYQDELALTDRWEVEGTHYARTLQAWRQNLDRRRDVVMPFLQATYGRDTARLWLAYWRVFFMACEETFARHSGTEYFVGHYLFSCRPG